MLYTSLLLCSSIYLSLALNAPPGEAAAQAPDVAQASGAAQDEATLGSEDVITPMFGGGSSWGGHGGWVHPTPPHSGGLGFLSGERFIIQADVLAEIEIDICTLGFCATEGIPSASAGNIVTQLTGIGYQFSIKNRIVGGAPSGFVDISFVPQLEGAWLADVEFTEQGQSCEGTAFLNLGLVGIPLFANFAGQLVMQTTFILLDNIEVTLNSCDISAVDTGIHPGRVVLSEQHWSLPAGFGNNIPGLPAGFDPSNIIDIIGTFLNLEVLFGFILEDTTVLDITFRTGAAPTPLRSVVSRSFGGTAATKSH